MTIAANDYVPLDSRTSGGVGTMSTARLYGTTANTANVTQITSRTTTVINNNPVGTVTLVSAAGSATAASFTVTNSFVDAGDTINLSVQSGTDPRSTFVTAVAAGSFNITTAAISGTTTEAPVINFTVIKGTLV